MGEDTAGFVNLDTCVRSVMADLKDFRFRNYRHLLNFAAEGYTELNLFAVDNIKTVLLFQNENFTVDLPKDYIKYLKVGIVINGKVWTLGYNKDIAMPREVNECGLTIPSIISCSANDTKINFPSWGFYFSNHFRNGQYVGELYGFGGGFNFAYYKIDQEKRQIVLTDNLPKNQIVLEYKSSGVSAEGASVIPKQCMRAVKEYIHWKRLEYDDRVPMSTKQRREKQYYIQFEMLHNFENLFTLEEYLDHTYQQSKSTPKR